jgi:hypothetical protein
MMLSTVLTTLGSYLSNSFIVGDFMPALFFSVMNVLMGYWLSFALRRYLDGFLANSSVGQYAYGFCCFLIATAVLAYVLSSLSPKILEFLEGQWGDTWSSLLVAPQSLKFSRLNDELKWAVHERVFLEQDTPSWVKDLQTARAAGSNNHPGTNQVSENDPAALAIQHLWQSRSLGKPVAYDDLRNAFRRLKVSLEQNDAKVTSGTGLSLLDDLQQVFLKLVDYATQQAQTRHVDLVNQLNSRFGVQGVAPTAMGNIANTVQSYSVTRYEFNFEALWPRLQHCVQADQNMYGVLQDAKTKLEFLTVSCVLTFSWSWFWAVVLAIYGLLHDSWLWIPFVVVAIGGPLSAYGWYRVAVEQYRSLGYIFRSCVDLYRFSLLSDLAIPLPVDAEDEAVIWDYVNRWSTYGEKANFRYLHK